MNQGAILQRVTAAKGKSVLEIAAELGVSRVHIYKMFRSRFISSEHIFVICRWLDLSPGTFFPALSTEGRELVVSYGVTHPTTVNRKAPAVV